MEKSPLEQPHITSPDKEKEDDGSFTFEIDGIELKATKKEFEYPEHIQKETGILGYERTIVDKESVFSLIKSLYYSDNSQLKSVSSEEILDLEKVGIVDLDSFIKYLDESVASVDEENNPLEYALARKLQIVASPNATALLLNNLSRGKYPDQCYTHQLGGYVSRDRQKEYIETFTRDKFFIQKIYDIDLIKERVEKNKNEDVFSEAPPGRVVIDKSNVSIFDKKTGKALTMAKEESENSTFPISELANLKYYDAIKKGELFAATPLAGFNVQTHSFFDEPGMLLKPSFGFSIKDDFFKKYLNKSLEIYTKQCKNIDFNHYRSESESAWGVDSLVNALVLSDKELSDFVTTNERGKNNYEQYEQEFQELCIAVIEKIEKENSIQVKDFAQGRIYSAWAVRWQGSQDDWRTAWEKFIENPEEVRRLYSEIIMTGIMEFNLPVFIGRDDIPQLCWGHAKYAHLLTGKGLNFIEFKHADNLPNNVEKDSDPNTSPSIEK